MNYERNRTLVVSAYYLAGAMVSVDTLGNYLALNIDIDKIVPGVFPNTSGISLGMNYADYSPFHKESNFSYPRTSMFAKTTRIPVYVNGIVLEGTIPSEIEIPEFRFVGIQPENFGGNSAWIELENYGESNIDLNEIFLKWTFRDSVKIGTSTLSPGARIKICLFNDLSQCPMSESIILEDLTFGPVGEFVLSKNGYPIDYIAWGRAGNMADSVRMINEKIESKNFFNTEMLNFVGPVVLYETGSFYQGIPSREDSTVLSWNLFSARQKSKNLLSLPSAEPLSLSDSSIVYLSPNEKMNFSWTPVNGAKSYCLVVVRASDSSLVYENTTENTSDEVELPYGEYLWGVASSKDDNMAGWSVLNLLAPGTEFIKNIVNKISSDAASPNLTWIDLLLKNSQKGVPIYNLSAIPQAARKDSYMLDVKWGQYILNYSWDSPRNSSSFVDKNWNLQFSSYNEKFYNREESWRCWIVAASILNHYNGGNITQDELKFFKFGKKNPILGAFPQGEDGGGYESDIDDVLSWSLNISNSKLHKNNGRPSEASIIQSLSVGRPVVIWQKQHIMVIDAVMKDPETEKFAFRFLNIDNNGTSEWKVYQNEKEIKRAWFPELTLSPQTSKLYIDVNENKKMELDADFILDSDGDGLLDFDEEYRFLTRKDQYDSDGDEINDKMEIMSYTQYEPYSVGGVIKETVADIDGDGRRAEMDEDSDNGGKKDGLEDMNRNGIKDVGETNPYIAFDDFNSSNPEMPGGFAFYAFSNLRINDGVKCFNGNEHCDVGSAAINSTEYFPLIIGARASVGNVYSRGNVFFRSHSCIYGNVVLADYATIDNISLQNGSIIKGNITNLSDAEWFSEFPIVYPLPDYNFETAQSISVSAGTAVDLYDGAAYDDLKVERGGTLRIHSGEMWVGSLDFEPGAKIEFVSPGYQTILHINGSFIWRGGIQNQETLKETIAKGFKLVQHSSQKMYVDEQFFGSIVAPRSHVIIGQANKVFYGAVVAKDISVHQYAYVNYVEFAPITVQYAIQF